MKKLWERRITNQYFCTKIIKWIILHNLQKWKYSPLRITIDDYLESETFDELSGQWPQGCLFTHPCARYWSDLISSPCQPPGRHVIGICTVAGVTGDRGVNTAELPLGFHSAAHLLFFCSPISPLWSAHQFLCSMTSTVLDHMSYSLIKWSQLLLTLEYTFLPGSECLKNLKVEGYLGDLWWSNRFPGSLRSAASSLGPFSNRTVPHTDIWTMNF